MPFEQISEMTNLTRGEIEKLDHGSNQLINNFNLLIIYLLRFCFPRIEPMSKNYNKRSLKSVIICVPMLPFAKNKPYTRKSAKTRTVVRNNTLLNLDQNILPEYYRDR